MPKRQFLRIMRQCQEGVIVPVGWTPCPKQRRELEAGLSDSVHGRLTGDRRT